MLTPLLATQVGRRRERFWKTFVGTIGIIDLWPPSLLLILNAGVLELLDERLLSPKTALSDKLPRLFQNPNLLICCVAHMQRFLAGIHVPRSDSVKPYENSHRDGHTT